MIEITRVREELEAVPGSARDGYATYGTGPRRVEVVVSAGSDVDLTVLADLLGQWDRAGLLTGLAARRAGA